MRREIKFRGKRVYNGEWVYGDFVRAWDNTCYIITELGPDVTCCYDCGTNDITAFEVISETVGQHTGLHDKNGKGIYEGDIVEYEDYSGGLYLFKEQPKTRGTVSIADLLNGMYLKGLGSFNDGNKVEIIGNIHDNPKLLEEV